MKPLSVILFLTSLISSSVLADNASRVTTLPFGADVEFNMSVYEAKLTEGSIGLDEAQRFCEAMVTLCDDPDLPVADRPLSKARVLSLHGEYLALIPGQEEAAITELERVLATLSVPLETNRRTASHMRKIYCEAMEDVTAALAREPGDALDSWTTEYVDSPLYGAGPFFRDGIAIAKLARADHLFNEKRFADARAEYQDIVRALPKDKNVSRASTRLQELDALLMTDRYRQYLRHRRQALVAGPVVFLSLLALVALVCWRRPQLNIFDSKWYERWKSDPNGSMERSEPGRNDPLMNFILARWRPGGLALFVTGVLVFFVLHFVVAAIDGNLYYGQQGFVSGLTALVTDFDGVWSTFTTIPRGHAAQQKEYFFNDYYGLIVNGLINPLVFCLIVAIYRRYTRMWEELFRHETLKVRDEKVTTDLFAQMYRSFNKRWFFWLSFSAPAAIVVSMWVSVYNQPDRSSYLDFGEGVMPVYHGLYLFLMWHMLGMLGLRIVAGVGIIDRVFNKLMDRSQVVLQLKPLHPDGCGGMAPLGRFALGLHWLVLLIGISVSCRVVLDFIMVGTSIWKSPQLLVGVLAFVGFSPIIFFGPMLIVRSRMLGAKARMLDVLNREYATQHTRFLESLAGDEVDGSRLDYLQKLAEVHAHIAHIPSWPFDMRTLSTFAGTVSIPLLIPAVLQILLGLM